MLTQKRLRILSALFLFMFACLAVQPATAATPAQAASLTAAGTVILIQGDVAVRRGGTESWEPAKPDQKLHEGDAIRTGPGSSCAILCVDESQIKLNEKTMLIMKNVAPSPRLKPGEITPTAPKPPPTSIYQVPNGEIWLRNKREKFNFELETPAVTATIRGTEINIRVRPDGATQVILLEGEICLVNAYGEVCLLPGEQGLVLPGQAPTKQVLVQPADAVQWSLYYPGIFSFRDLPLTPQPGQTRAPAGPQAALIQSGESAYDQGRLSEAQQAGESVLAKEPDNARALTLLGWVALQKHDPDAALGFLRRVRGTDEMAIIGLALSRYRLGDIAGAYEVMQAAHRLPPNPSLVAMASFFALLAGRVDQARTALENATRQYPSAVLPRALLAQICLVQNRKDAARQEAAAALSGSPNSPLAQLTMGLVRLAFFEPEEAAQNLDKAIAADPRFVDAYVYLARIWLGSGHLKRARTVTEQALRLAPKDGTVLSLAGFVRLAFRDFPGAKTFFEQAVKANPRLGEPHLGLAIVSFRYRNFGQGLEEMLTATLLEPRTSLYQSELGKALYQTRSFDRALEVWDYAKTLDPQSPTPYLYKGIALSDLNRPGDAIQEINESIAKNDNTAIFRGRQSLDQDRAVRNYDLARAYGQLDLRDWAVSKAVTAVKNDPLNSSAHLFLSKSFEGNPKFLLTQVNEDLLFRLLAPANQSTFFSIENDNYTPMYEMPYARLLAQGGIGAWREKNSIWDNKLTIYGGLPGLGGWARLRYFDNRGFRTANGQTRFYGPDILLKWEPTVNDSLFGGFSFLDMENGDDLYPNDYNYKNSPFTRGSQRQRIYELGYVHRFNPKATLMTYFTYQNWDLRAADKFLNLPFDPFTVNVTDYFKTDREFINFQAQQNLVLGRHNLIAGIDYFSGHRYFEDKAIAAFFFGGFPIGSQTFLTKFTPPEWSYSFYLLDYWRLHPKLLLELGVIKDFSKNAKDSTGHEKYNSLWSPVVGLNWFITPQHTLRFALQRHLITHQGWAAGTIMPSETAGFPWLISIFNATEVRQVGATWEAEWDPKTFTTLRLEANRLSLPVNLTTGELGWVNWKEYHGSLTLNRILSTSWGLSGAVIGKRVVPDVNDVLILNASPPGTDFWELRSFLNLSFLHRTGWQGGIRGTLVQQYLRERDNPLFGLVDLRFGKEFANKRGLALLEVTNLFDRHFSRNVEPFVGFDFFRQEFFPARRILFKLAFYF